jgi:hypothetical protein
MTMTGRFIDHGIRILTAASLLLAVMFSPIRVTIASQSAHSPHALSHNFATLTIGHSGQFAMSARPSLREAASPQLTIENVLDADIEGEQAVISPLASVSFDILPSTCPKPYCKPAHVAVALTSRPLRC